jgi:hypothetical protein
MKTIWLKLYVFLLILKLMLVMGLCWISQPDFQALKNKKALVKRFMLTDYCLSTESRHTRHIGLPEIIAPFQDFPAYHEHFPSSSFFQKTDSFSLF